jgi:hypothetical protein
MKKTFLAVLVAALSCLAVSAQAKTKLEGAWRVTEVTRTGPNAGTNSNPQPGLYVFAGKHYSIVTVNSDKPRPDLPADASKATAAELNAVWGPFTANSGTYEISGDTLTTHAMVAKNPGVMRSGSSATYSIKVQGNTMTITQTKNTNGPVNNPTTTKLMRVE